MMKIVKALVFASVVAVLACGSKDKKKAETPAPTTAGPSGETAAPSSDTGEVAPAPAKKSPELQQVVYFEFDQAMLDDAARSKLNENADWLREKASRELLIEGHTDEVGTTEYNAALGERRAQAARDYLVRLGIDGKRIKIITYGEEKPASGQDALNRRSVFIATKK